MPDSVYTPTGTYNDSGMSEADRAKIAAYKQQWLTAFNNNDRAGMDAAHAGAEGIRAQYGYSGGADGSEYHAVTPAQPQYSGATLALPNSAEKYIDSLYSAQQSASLAALKSAYDQNVLTINAEKTKIAPYYQDARNQTATQSELSRAAFNELAAARGLSSGAGGQASLAMSNVFQSNMSGLSRAEADAYAEVEFQRAKLETAYKNDIAQAITNGNLAKAQALYNEYIRVDNALMSVSQAQADQDYRAWSARNDTYNTNYNNQLMAAQILAQYGDFSGFKMIGYTPQQIEKMQQEYAAKNAG